MFQYLNERVRCLTVIDIALTKFAVFFSTLIIIKLFPQLLMINFTVLIFLALLCAIKPFHTFWFKS